MDEKIKQAVQVLDQGGIVIFPTDTAFGIGCRMDNLDGIKKLFQIRKRPETQATPVLVSDFAMAEKYWIDVPTEVKEKLIDTHWPGAVTVILPCKKELVPHLVRGGGENLGLRAPNNATILEIINKVGIPLLGPSANFHGKKTPYMFEDLNPELIKLVDYVVPGECSVKQASTVVDCTQTPWKVLREGAVKL